MIELSLAEIAGAVAGTLADGARPGVTVTGAVRIDSRAVGPGDLFVALPGEHADGHDFAGEALDACAVAVLAARPVGGPAVLVGDPLHALGQLARVVRQRLQQLMVIGVTGSSGKTSTKDLLAAVMAAAGPSHAPHGSFNNELGVPLTILEADEQTRFLVLEMGSRGVGHIDYLCRIAQPDVGIVLNVGAAHAGEFGGRDITAKAKGELVASLPANGLAVLNGDDELVAGMAGRTQARVVLTSTAAPPAPSSTITAGQIVTDEQACASFQLHTPRGQAGVRLRVHGVHQVSNALAAAAAGLAAGLTPQQVAEALSGATAASQWRMEVTRRADGLTVVNDAYNANPDSMAAALQALAAMAAHDPSVRRIAVLGEMLELGDEAEAGHEGVGKLAASLGIEVIAVGAGAAGIAKGASAVDGAQHSVAASAEEAIIQLERSTGPGDLVLVKASRAVALERVAEALLRVGTVKSG